MDELFQHMLRLGDFVWELRNHLLEQHLRAPDSAAARVQKWLTAAVRDCPPPSPASRQGLSGLPLHRERHTGLSPARGPLSLPGPAWLFFQALLGQALPTVDHRTPFVTAWEVHIMGAESAREWDR